MHPIETLEVGAVGNLHCLRFVEAKRAALFLASTSEVYGDPQMHPTAGDVLGEREPIGSRSVYDEGKRFAEAATMAYLRAHEMEIRITRIFNTHGRGCVMQTDERYRTFIHQALLGEPMTVHGDGSQTLTLLRG
jgi:dTDP-glucose 4,6-dehydratase